MYSNADPIIEEGDQFVTIIPLNESYSADNLSSDDRVNDSDRVNDRVSDRVNDRVKISLAGEQESLFRYIEANPGKNTEVIAGVMKKSVPTISRYIKELKELGKVEFRGAPKTGGYYVRKDV